MIVHDCIVMAGGSGTRLWPASNSASPKQFLDSGNGRSFFQTSLERAFAVIDTEGDGKVIVIAGKAHVDLILRDCEIFSKNELKHLVLIPEPEAKNTAAAIACGTLYTDWVSGEDRTILVLTSDHIIKPTELFIANAAAAAAYALQDKLAVFGITPSRPETGYGYIEAAELLSNPEEPDFVKKQGRPEDPRVYRAASFREKPGLSTAEEFIEQGNFFWNSGMFVFGSRFILHEFRGKAADVIRPFNALTAPGETSFRTEKGVRILENWRDLDRAYREVKSISFDYAIAEKCASTVMVAAAFDWFDVGSWDAYTGLVKDSSEVYASGAKNCFVDSDIPVALCGTEDLIVVIRTRGGKPSALIAKKGESQKVRD
ncbi:MAG: mannose-1-phosphate guanylyltransferase, partial [Spirochaetaceae bacterium]|nr:mannose-1-phosphate guanylyltransferase [Spirochaetaceae bacterium]